MKLLSDYFRFVKENFLEEAARENIRLAWEMELPVMTYYKDVPEEFLMTQTIKSLSDFADSLADGTYLAKQEESLKKWENDQIDNAPAGLSIQPKDLVVIYAMQRKMLRKFVTRYTTDADKALAILDELDNLQIASQEAAVEVFFKKQKKTEEALQQSEEQLRMLVENVKDHAIFVTSPEGIVLTWNEGAQRIKGYTQEEIVGKSIATFYTDEEIARNEPAYNLEMAEKLGSYETEGWRKRKNGERFWADVFFTALRDKEGKLTGFSKVTRDMTERKKAEDELKKSNERFFTILSMSPIAIYLTRVEDGRYIYVNDAFEKLLGRTRDEIIGKTGPELNMFSKEVRDKIVRKVMETNGKVDNMEFSMQGLNGEPKDILFSSSLLELDGTRCFLGTVIDITERKKTEAQIVLLNKELENSNAFLNAIFENIPNMIFVKEAKELRFVRFNKAGEDLLGMPREELIGKNDYDFFPKKEADFFTAKDRETLDSGGIFNINEEQITTQPHGQRWLHTRKIPINNTSGEPAYLLGISEDITDQKLAADELKKSNRRFLQIFNLSPVPTYITEVESGRFQYVNEAFEKLFGYRSEEALGKTSVDLGIVDAPYRKKVASVVTEHQGMLKNIDLKLRVRDGTIKDVLVSSDVMEIDGKKCFLATAIDITDRKRVEEKISALNLELGQSNVQLNSVNKELEAFTYSVSHDLRAPLRAVNGYANMLEEDFGSTLDEEGKRLLNVIRYNAQKMGQLIDDLLAFSRLGRKELDKTSEDMNQLVEGALIELGKSTKLKADVRIGKLHGAKVDYGLMHQAFVNLISNAVKYSSKRDKPTVEITSEEQNGEVVYAVSDNGVGFDMRYYDKLFGVFQRLHKQEEFDGTGVGLAIVQRVVNKHNGRVWAHAEVDKGATFYVALPKN